MILPRASNSPGYFMLIPRAVSHNVNRFGGGGIKVSSTGVFSIRPQSALESASAVSISDISYSTVDFYGVIPGGDSFKIPQSSLSTTNDTGTGFSWTVDISGGTDFLIIGGDDSRIGSGGVAPFTVGYTVNSFCLSSTSPSSTASSPGSYPTSTSGSLSGSSGNS